MTSQSVFSYWCAQEVDDRTLCTDYRGRLEEGPRQHPAWAGLRARLQPTADFLNKLLDVWRIRFSRQQSVP